MPDPQVILFSGKAYPLSSPEAVEKFRGWEIRGLNDVQGRGEFMDRR